MSNLDKLITIDGVVVATEFSLDGKLINYKLNTDIEQSLIEKKAELCAVVTMLFNALAGSFSELSKMNWIPQDGWMYVGGDWVVCVGNNNAVFVEKEKVDFNKLFRVLVGNHQ
jgi:roadblock/LC7 domain-containing protein